VETPDPFGPRNRDQSSERSTAGARQSEAAAAAASTAT